MSVLLAILAAAAPTAIYTLLLWWLDRYEKEPLPLMAAAFLWGSLPAVALAALAGPLLGAAPSTLGPGIGASRLAPLVEEPAKALALLLIARLARDEIDGALDGIVYGALVGFGFSMSENLLYFLAYPDALGGLFWVRSVLFGLNHALFSAIVGLAFGVTRGSPRPGRAALWVGAALALAIGLHALHNVAVGFQLPGMALSWAVQFSGVLTVLAVAGLAWRHEAAWIRSGLGDEIRMGTIGPADYAAITSAPRRARAELRALAAGGLPRYLATRRLHHLMTELAFCKQRPGRQPARDALRQQIIALRASLAGEDDPEPLVA